MTESSPPFILMPTYVRFSNPDSDVLMVESGDHLSPNTTWAKSTHEQTDHCMPHHPVTVVSLSRLATLFVLQLVKHLYSSVTTSSKSMQKSHNMSYKAVRNGQTVRSSDQIFT